MGLRSLNIPANAQPKDIGNPLPSQEDTLGSVLQGFHAPKMAAQAGPEQTMGQMMGVDQPQAGPQQPSVGAQPPQDMNRAPAGQQQGPQMQTDKAAQAAMDAAFGQMAQDLPKDVRDRAAQVSAKDAKETMDAEFGKPVVNADTGQAEPASFGAKVRAFMSLGRNDLEKGNALKKLQSAGVIGEFKHEGSVFYATHPGSKDFQRVDSEHFFSSLPESLADVAGPAIEMGAQVAAQGLAASAAYVSGGMTVPASAMVGAAAGGGAGPLARDAAVKMAGIEDETYNTFKDTLVGIGGATALEGAGLAAGSWINNRWGKVAARNAFAPKTPAEQLELARDIRLSVESIANEYPVLKTPLKEAGAKAANAIEASEQKLAMGVQAANAKAVQIGGKSPQKVDNILGKLKEAIIEGGGSFDDAGRVVLPERPSKILSQEATQVSKGGFIADEAQSTAQSRLAQASQSSLEPFGDPHGRQFLEELSQKYEVLNAGKVVNGGVPVKNLLDEIHYVQSTAKFDPRFAQNTTGRVNGVLQELSSAGIQDRDAAFSAILGGSDSSEFKSYKNAYSAYQQNIGAISAVKAAFKSVGGDVERIADATFRANNADIIATVKHTLGETSQEWKQLRGAWVMSKANEAIENGVWQPQKFLDSVNGLGKSALAEVGSSAEIASMKKLAQLTRYVNLEGLQSKIGRQAMNESVDLMTKLGSSTTGMLKFLFKSTGGNVDALNYLRDEAIQGAMASTKDSAYRKTLSELSDALYKLEANSVKVPMTVRAIEQGAAGKVAKSAKESYVYVPKELGTAQKVGIVAGAAAGVPGSKLARSITEGKSSAQEAKDHLQEEIMMRESQAPEAPPTPDQVQNAGNPGP